MKNKFKSGDIFYKIWKDEKDVYGERYVVKTILDNEVLVCIDRKNKEKFISPRDTNIILDKNQAIAKFNNLKQLQLQSSTIQAKPKTFHHTTKEKNPNFKKFNRFHKGETRYIVSNTPSGATITEYKIEKLIYDSLSVIVKDKNENQKKIYEIVYSVEQEEQKKDLNGPHHEDILNLVQYYQSNILVFYYLKCLN